ncbi:MAG: DUF6285 domain-containing protein [Rhodospirillaceae bacterium]
MRKIPSGRALEDIAEQAEAALAANPDDHAANYKQAMIRNARAISERHAEAGDAPERAEAERLTALLGGGDLRDLNRRLVSEIRSGQAPAGTHEHLLETVRAELAESNPRYLAKLSGN